MFFTNFSSAEEVQLKMDGLLLNANLEKAQDSRLSDGVVLILHGGLAHNKMEMIVYLQELLKERGLNSLAITLSLGLNNRNDMYDCKVPHRHHNEDAVKEIKAWVRWLEQQGANHITVLGHSRGGGQIALYASDGVSRSVNAVILMAPVTQANGDIGYEARYGQPLAPVLKLALDSAQRGTMLEHVNIMFCRDTSAQPDAFLSYYGPSAKVDSPTLVQSIEPPLLVLVAGNDEIVINLEQKMKNKLKGKNKALKVIPGADHFFRDVFMDDAADQIKEFLDSLTE